MTTIPEYSFIIPVYNGERFLIDNIRSLQGQTCGNFEAIYVNDGSTDGSERILREESERDSRIKWFTKPNGGISSAISFGLQHASSDYILLLDQDDVAVPDRLEKTVQAFRNGAELVMGDYEIVDEHLQSTGKIITMPDYVRPDTILLEQLKRSYILGSALAFRNKGDFTFHPASGGTTDFDLSFKMLLNGYRFAYIPEVLIRYRVHSRNTSANYRNQKQDLERVFEQYDPDQLAEWLMRRGYDRGEVFSALGILHLFLEHLPDAEGWLTKAQRLLKPEQGRPYHESIFYLGVLKYRQGDWTGAKQNFGQLLRRHEGNDQVNPSVYNNYGCLMMREGNVRLAEHLFRQALEINPEYMDARMNLDFCLNQVVNWEQYRMTSRLLRDQLTHTRIKP